jgi:competence protein ComEA
MYNFDKKQKIILGVLAIIVVGFICYYVYSKEDYSSEQLQLEESLEIQKEETETQEEYSDDRILVHVSGAVNKEGVVELKADSRILDAIEQARRSKR